MAGINDFINAKNIGRKISILTAYDYLTAKIIDKAGIDAILVGDSLGMVVLGYDDTTKVTMEDMIHHIKAVSRGCKNTLVIGDMPFLSYHMGVYESVKNAGRLISEGGCKAVKLEGGKNIKDSVEAIINAGIPVMGHLGYTPQSVNVFGGHKAQGKTIDTASKILEDALILQDSGVFAIVLECVPYKIAEYVTKKLRIPTISIGAGEYCDGQVLVTTDLLALDTEFKPRHSKIYYDFGNKFLEIVKKYKDEVEKQKFPTRENSFEIDNSIFVEFEKMDKLKK